MTEVVVKGQLTSAERVKLVCQDFQKLLEDLTFNCRPLIEDLTKKASFHVAYAPHIVKVLGDHVEKVKPSAKLPGLYLIDSIMKNLNGDYLRYFKDVIPVIFCRVFEVCVEPAIRKALHKLRLSWATLLSPMALYSIDMKCHSLDENWPIVSAPVSTSPPSPTIFVNPHFLSANTTGSTIHINPALASGSTVKEAVKTSGVGSGIPLPQMDQPTHPVAGDEASLKMKRLEVLQALGRKKERLLEEDRQATGLSVTTSNQQNSKPTANVGTAGSKHVKPIENSKPTANVGTAGSKHVKPIEAESKEKRPRLSKPEQHGLEGKGIAELKQELLTLSRLPPDDRDKGIDTVQNMAEELFKSGRLSRAEYSEVLTQLDQVAKGATNLHPPEPPKALTDSVQTTHRPTHDAHSVDPQLTVLFQPVSSSRPTLHPQHTFTHPQPHAMPGPTPQGPPPHGRPMLHPHSVRSRSPSPHGPEYHSVPPPHPGMYRPREPYFRRGGRRRGRPPYFTDPRYHGPRAGHSWDHPRPRTPPTLLPLQGEKKPPTETGVELNIPDLPLEAQALKKSYPGIVDLIHAGDSCSSCGMRLAISSEEYAKHLDWHYQQNKMKEKSGTKGSRNWYIHPDDWIAQSTKTESPSLDSGDLPLGQEGGEENVITVDSASQICRGLPGDSGRCALCGEKLEHCWDEDEESWYYKDATRGPNEQVYHVTCFQDAKEMKVFSPKVVTPSTPARNLSYLVAKLFSHNILEKPGASLSGNQPHEDRTTNEALSKTENKLNDTPQPSTNVQPETSTQKDTEQESQTL